MITGLGVPEQLQNFAYQVESARILKLEHNQYRDTYHALCAISFEPREAFRLYSDLRMQSRHGLGEYPAPARQLLPRQWYYDHYPRWTADELIELALTGRNGMAKAIVADVCDGAKRDSRGCIPYEVHHFIYEMVPNHKIRPDENIPALAFKLRDQFGIRAATPVTLEQVQRAVGRDTVVMCKGAIQLD